MSDNRAEKVYQHYGATGLGEMTAGERVHTAAMSIAYLERAGLVVFDPDDPEVLEEAAFAVFGGSREFWPRPDGRDQQTRAISIRTAHRVISALKAGKS